jgi:hypothetical protein
MRLERDCISEDKCRDSLFSSFAKGLAFLWAVDTAEEDAFRIVVVDFEGIAVEDGDNEAREVSNGSGGDEQEQERAESKDMCSSPPHEWRRDKKTPVR